MTLKRLRLTWGPAAAVIALATNYAYDNAYWGYYFIAVPLVLVWCFLLPVPWTLWTTRSSKYADSLDRKAIRRLLFRQQSVFSAARLTSQKSGGQEPETIFPRIVKHRPEANFGLTVVIDRPQRVRFEDVENACADIASALRLSFPVTIVAETTELAHLTRLVIGTRAPSLEPRAYTDLHNEARND